MHLRNHHHHHYHHHEDENQIMIASGELITRQEGLFGRWKKFFFTLSKDGVLIKFKSSNFHTPMQRYLMVYSSQLNCKGDQKKEDTTSGVPQVTPSLPQPAVNMCGKENSLLLLVENSLGERETLLVVAPIDEQYVMWMRGFEIVYEHAKYELTKSHYQMPDYSTSTLTSSSSLSSSLVSSTPTILNLLEHIPKSINFDLFKKGLKISKLVEVMIDPTVIANEKGIILGVNNAAEVLFEWRHTELIGESVKVLMPPVFANHHDEYMSEYVKHRVKRMIGKPRNVIGKTKSGRMFAVEISLGEIDHNNEEDFCEMAFMAVFRKINTNVWSGSEVQQDEKEFNEMLLSSESNKVSRTVDGHGQTNTPEDDTDSSEYSSDDSVIEQFLNSNETSNTQNVPVLQQLFENKHKVCRHVEKFKHHLETSFEKEAKQLRTKVLLLSKELEILEQENEKLFMQQEVEREHIELLEREMTIIFPASHIILLDMLNDTSTRDAILKWAKKGTSLYNQVSCCLSICEFKERFYMLSPRSTSRKGLKEMERQARLLFDEYFSCSAKYKVEIPIDVARMISLRLENPTCHMFHIALHSIILDMNEKLDWDEIFGKVEEI
ncbi:hypothetical protein C9374_009259 [Naegleria lovaniensis]|uniref:PH domain-containing protein n=1 Tax=Naegleria lovaniensis TaxID=51637 RepID=A0AA88GJP8_NAELO|nr:uncharacterized protein C9374_009259 [Naegleria lovaniensis]KAG2377348.1 hypothetical protein C9374_009259 [Naegleria lovaniensis]